MKQKMKADPDSHQIYQKKKAGQIVNNPLDSHKVSRENGEIRRKITEKKRK